MVRTKTIRIAYTPDSDDAFYYDALETGRVSLDGFSPTFHRDHMNALNQAALQRTYDVTAISSVIYPQIADQYAILSVGTSVGRGYGPVLVAKTPRSLNSLRGERVGVPGVFTTGGFLLQAFCPEAIAIPMPFDKIADAVACDEVVGGVMIHEELLYYPRLGLNRVADLGATWSLQTALPLPVGLNVIRRDLGRNAMERICRGIRASLRFGLDHHDETLRRVSCYGRGTQGACTSQFVSMFANQDSLCMPQDVRTALGVLLTQVVDLGYGEAAPRLDIVEGLQAVGVI